MTDHPVPPVDPPTGCPRADCTFDGAHGHGARLGAAGEVIEPAVYLPPKGGAAWAFEQLVGEVEILRQRVAALEARDRRVYQVPASETATPAELLAEQRRG